MYNCNENTVQAINLQDLYDRNNFLGMKTRLIMKIAWLLYYIVNKNLVYVHYTDNIYACVTVT